MHNDDHFLTPDVKYIEPVFHMEHFCRIHYSNEYYDSRMPSETLLNHVLLYKHGTSIKARRDHLKLLHHIHKLGPIVIDERCQFVMFPLSVSKNKNSFWLNLCSMLQFSKTDDEKTPTRIHFNDMTTLDIEADFKFCEKQYDKTLRVLDRSIKIREQPAVYVTRPVKKSR